MYLIHYMVCVCLNCECFAFFLSEFCAILDIAYIVTMWLKHLEMMGLTLAFLHLTGE